MRDPKDRALIRRAEREGWPITANLRALLVRKLEEAVEKNRPGEPSQAKELSELGNLAARLEEGNQRRSEHADKMEADAGEDQVFRVEIVEREGDAGDNEDDDSGGRA